jgi:hypothetical protein
MPPRIMYIERKTDGLSGPARIGRLRFSKTGKTLYYGGRKFEPLRGRGFKANYFDVESGDEYWISGCKKRGRDRLYPGVIEIDQDVREEYWAVIRGMPECKDQEVIRCNGKYSVQFGFSIRDSFVTTATRRASDAA